MGRAQSRDSMETTFHQAFGLLFLLLIVIVLMILLERMGAQVKIRSRIKSMSKR